VIGKYTFRDGDRKLRPFLGAGFAFRTSWQETRNELTLRDTTTGLERTVRSLNRYRTQFEVGAVASAGVNLKRGRFLLAPELRYTRWGTAYNLDRNRNQAEFLLSVRF
jgi:outer membrane protein W